MQCLAGRAVAGRLPGQVPGGSDARRHHTPDGLVPTAARGGAPLKPPTWQAKAPTTRYCPALRILSRRGLADPAFGPAAAPPLALRRRAGAAKVRGSLCGPMTGAAAPGGPRSQARRARALRRGAGARSLLTPHPTSATPRAAPRQAGMAAAPGHTSLGRYLAARLAEVGCDHGAPYWQAYRLLRGPVWGGGSLGRHLAARLAEAGCGHGAPSARRGGRQSLAPSGAPQPGPAGQAHPDPEQHTLSIYLKPSASRATSTWRYWTSSPAPTARACPAPLISLPPFSLRCPGGLQPRPAGRAQCGAGREDVLVGGARRGSAPSAVFNVFPAVPVCSVA